MIYRSGVGVVYINITKCILPIYDIFCVVREPIIYIEAMEAEENAKWGFSMKSKMESIHKNHLELGKPYKI